MISKKKQHNNCTFIVISDAGLNHRINKVPNQDAANFIVSGDDYVMSVSDGVGSCKKANIGSKAAVEAANKVFCKLHDEGLVLPPTEISNLIIKEWKNQLSGEAPDDCCATLKTVMKFENKLLLFSIGDGLLAITSCGKKVCSPTDDTIFSNQTRCLNESVDASEFWSDTFKLDLYVPYTVFICTDGIANGIQEGRELDLVAEIESGTASSKLKDELESLVIDIAEYSSDDRTLGVIKYERENAESKW